jgi:hypothetical protein
VAVVYDPDSELCLLPLPGVSGQPVQQEATGLHNALADAAMHFDVVDTGRLKPARYKALLVANAVAPPPSLLKALREWVAAGGLLIATHETSLRNADGSLREDFAWADLLGVRFTGVSAFEEANFGWLGEELRGAAPEYPVLFRDRVLEVRATTARPLAELVYPEGNRTRERFTDGETPYTHFKTFSGKPLVTINAVGKGNVVYIAAPIGREIAVREDPWLKRLVAFAVRKYAAGLSLDVRAPAGVQVVFGRKDGGATHVLSLVNLLGGLALSGDSSVSPQVGPVHATIPLAVFASRPKSVRPIGADGVRWAVTAKGLEIDVASIGHHAVLAIT